MFSFGYSRTWVFDKKNLQKTRVGNFYNNKISRNQVWEKFNPTIKRVIQDIAWRQLIRSRVLIVENINVHNLLENFHGQYYVNVGSLK